MIHTPDVDAGAAGAAGVQLPADAARLLDRALRVLLAPLAHDNVLEWREALRAPLLELMATDTLGVHFPFLPAPAEWSAPHLTSEVLADFTTRLQFRDVVSDRVVGRGLGVAHQWEVIGRRELRETALYNELQRPHRLFDTFYVRTQLDDGALVRLWMTRGREARDATPDDGRLALLRLAVPALRAGIGAWRRLGAQRAALAGILDRMNDGVLLFDLAGVPVHANSHAERLLAPDPEATTVRAAAQQMAWAIGAMHRRDGATVATGASRRDASSGARLAAAPVREVRTARGAWRLEGTLAVEGLFGRDPTVLVLVRRASPEPLDDGALRARYGLTAQEVIVARLMAAGLSNAEIAARLGTALATARNHAAHVLEKLGTGKRTRIGPLLMGQPPA